MSENIVAMERTPEAIAFEVRALAGQFKVIALSYALQIGQLLCEAKALVNHGEWGTWIKGNTEFSQSTANNLMRIFEEYGADQVGIFGNAKSQTLGNLSYSKALALLDVPAEEREAFAEDNNVEELSTRELEKLIKERDEALKGKAEAETQMKCAQEREKDVKIDYTSEQKKGVELAKKISKLEAELKAMKAQPIEVAVQEADPEAVNEAVKAAEEKLEKEIKALKAELAEESQKAKELEKKLTTADPSTAQFKVLFEETQGLMTKMLGLLDSAPPDKREGLKKALSALFDKFGGMLKEDAA